MFSWASAIRLILFIPTSATARTERERLHSSLVRKIAVELRGVIINIYLIGWS